MRSRKPWVRFRRRLCGWKVLFNVYIRASGRLGTSYTAPDGSRLNSKDSIPYSNPHLGSRRGRGWKASWVTCLANTSRQEVGDVGALGSARRGKLDDSREGRGSPDRFGAPQRGLFSVGAGLCARPLSFVHHLLGAQTSTGRHRGRPLQRTRLMRWRRGWDSCHFMTRNERCLLAGSHKCSPSKGSNPTLFSCPAIAGRTAHCSMSG